MSEVSVSSSLHAMQIAREDNDDFFLFLDIFVHHTGSKITATCAYYGEDIDWSSHGVDLENVFLTVNGLCITGTYIPHRLDSWEPAILIDFEHPELASLISGSDSGLLEIEIAAGSHQQAFELSTRLPEAYDVTMSVIIKNENRWIKHYLDYYLDCLEVDHIFVYDNLTTDRDELAVILKPYIVNGAVTYILWDYRWRNRYDRKQIGQPPQQSHTLNRFGNCTWIGFFDVDEFLRIPGKTLPEFLNTTDTDDVDGLSFGIRWFMYKGDLDFEDIRNPLLSMFESKPDRLGRKRQKLLVAAKDVRFLRFHWLEEGKRELAIPDDEIYFHHYYLRDARFDEGKKEVGTVHDEYMLEFAANLAPINLSPVSCEKIPAKPSTPLQWITHLTNAIRQAEHHVSKLEGDVLEIHGMSGLNNRHFLNTLCNFEGARYLEIGSLAGASLCAAVYNNRIEATAIDDWSQFTRPKKLFYRNLEKYQGDASVRVIESDCFEVNPDDLGRFNIFFYDGDHSEENQYKALKHFFPVLEDRAIVIVDDWNWPQVRAGTHKAIQELDVKILYEEEIKLPEEEVRDMPRHAGKQTWWNGIYVALLEKPENFPVYPVKASVPSGHAFTEVIIYSKDRACQMEALLRTKERFLHLSHSTSVLYTASDAKFEEGYNLLKPLYPKVNWVREADFRKDMLALLAKVDKSHHLMFLVDDIIFTRPYGGGETLRALENEEEILAVSLRLGENVTFCHPRQMHTTPPDLTENLRWRWRDAAAGYWNYPMSVDGNIYRAADLVDLIPALPFKYAGQMEAAMTGRKIDRELMICNREPSLVNLAVNKVQTSFNNPHGNVSADYLNEQFLQGNVIDVESVLTGRHDSCHIEPAIRLVPGQKSQAEITLDLRELTIYVINCEDKPDRRKFMEEQLLSRNLNVEFVEGLVADPAFIGQTLAHIRLLKRQDIKVPFIVLEDDAELTDDFSNEVTLPSGADAMYLGVSKFGLQNPGQPGWGTFDIVQCEQYTGDYLRVRNMLSRYGILYLTEAFRQAAIQASFDAISHPDQVYPGDVGYAVLQEDFLVLTPNQSYCVLSEKFSTSSAATTEALTPVGRSRIESRQNNSRQNNANGLPMVFVTGAGNWHRHPQSQTPDPQSFLWTTDADEKNVAASVFVDSAIMKQAKRPGTYRGKKIAWISESPAIAEKLNINQFVRDNIELIAASFDVLLMCDRAMCEMHPKFHPHPAGSNLPWIHEHEMAEKSEVCSMFVSPKNMVVGHGIRHQVAGELQDSIDLFGGPFGSRHLESKNDGLLPYRFSIAMENCKVSLYYTEKLTDCFATGTVPVYWGTPDIAEIFDMNGVIMLDDKFDIKMLTPELYEEMLPAVRNNFEIVKNLESSFDTLFRKYIASG